MIQAPEKKRWLEDPHGSFLGHLFRNQIRPTADLTIKCGVLEGIPNFKTGLNIWDMMNYHEMLLQFNFIGRHIRMCVF